jgi:hypothetical protein
VLSGGTVVQQTLQACFACRTAFEVAPRNKVWNSGSRLACTIHVVLSCPLSCQSTCTIHVVFIYVPQPIFFLT